MNIYDPSQWADVHGYVILMFVMAVTALWIVVHVIDGVWEDWLDERDGRGSLRDEWLLDRMRDDNRPQA